VVDVAQLVELQVVVLAVAGSNPVVHPIQEMYRPARAPAVHVKDVRVWRNW
jgi:hypothetical protein